MRTSRVAAGTLIVGLVVLTILLAVREAGDFERISGVTRRGSGDEGATLRGTGENVSMPGGAMEQDLPWEEAAADDRDGGSWRLRGQVIDLQHRPVAGVPVEWEKHRTTSGEDGRFEGPADGEMVALKAGEGWEGSRHVREAQRAVTLQVVRRLTLEIQVVDAADRPIEGVSGTGGHSYMSGADPRGGDNYTVSISLLTFGPTDESGRCELHLAVSTDHLQLQVAHDGVFAQERVYFPYQRAVVLRLGRRLAIRGEVVDAAGRRLDPRGVVIARPLDATQATVGSLDGSWIVGDSFTGFVATEGVEFAERPPEPFSLDVPGAGPWHVHFEPSSPDLAASDPVLVTAPIDDVRLVCHPAVSIRGQVLGGASAEFYVQWIPARGPGDHVRSHAAVSTGPDGAFRIRGLSAGPGRIFVRWPGDDQYGLLEGIRAPLDGVRVPLQSATPIVGRIADHQPPEGMGGATLQVRATDGVFVSSAGVVQADEFTPNEEVGTFSIRGLPPGRYELSWRWHAPWGGTGGTWTPFGVSVDLSRETEEIALPAPR